MRPVRPPEFWNRPTGSPAAALLAPLAWVYGAVARARFAAATPAKAAVPVLCVGNLIAGGAGKTPVALALGRRLAAQGLAPHFLSRGYGGRETGPLRVNPEAHDFRDVGDEALLLARVCPTWVSRDRPRGAAAAAAVGAGMVIMDDGFQNPSLAKDVSLIVVDGGYGFGNGHVMPAGPLRETVDDGLARAQALVLIGDDRTGVLERLRGSCRPDIPILDARLRSAPSPGADTGPVIAFTGIARPDKFFQTLRDAGYAVRKTHAFPDHHPFTRPEMKGLIAAAFAAGAQLITTEKDAVRLDPDFRAAVRVLTITVEWDDEDALESVLGPMADHG